MWFEVAVMCAIAKVLALRCRSRSSNGTGTQRRTPTLRAGRNERNGACLRARSGEPGSCQHRCRRQPKTDPPRTDRRATAQRPTHASAVARLDHGGFITSFVFAFDLSCFAFVFQSIAFAADGYDVSVMQQTIEHGRGQSGVVGKRTGPLRER